MQIPAPRKSRNRAQEPAQEESAPEENEEVRQVLGCAMPTTKVSPTKTTKDVERGETEEEGIAQTNTLSARGIERALYQNLQCPACGRQMRQEAAYKCHNCDVMYHVRCLAKRLEQGKEVPSTMCLICQISLEIAQEKEKEQRELVRLQRQSEIESEIEEIEKVEGEILRCQWQSQFEIEDVMEVCQPEKSHKRKGGDTLDIEEGKENQEGNKSKSRPRTQDNKHHKERSKNEGEETHQPNQEPKQDQENPKDLEDASTNAFDMEKKWAPIDQAFWEIDESKWYTKSPRFV